MSADRGIPENALAFIQECVRRRKIYWTYHVNMRMAGRYIARHEILESPDSYEIIEAYPHDKYLPSYLVLARHGDSAFHVLFAIDLEGGHVRIVTAYRPQPAEWETDFRTRRGRK